MYEDEQIMKSEYIKYTKDHIRQEVWKVHEILYKKPNELRIYFPICPICGIIILHGFGRTTDGFQCDNEHNFKYKEIKILKLYDIEKKDFKYNRRSIV